MADILAGICSGIAQTTVGYPLDTIKVLIQNNKSWKGMSPLMYYRGAGYPLASSIMFNSSVFSINERTYKYSKSFFISGLCSGLFVAPILFVFDIGKIKRQTNQSIKFKDIYRTKGLPITYCREGFAMSLYFGSYNYFRKYMNSYCAGGLAGLTSWTITYPLDIVRSRQIAQNISAKDALNQGKLWKGYIPCALRAIIVNGACFYVYEESYKIIKKYK